MPKVILDDDQQKNLNGLVKESINLQVQDLVYKLVENKYVVTGISNNKYTLIYISPIYNGRLVTGIGAYAFSYHASINDVIISDGIVSIGERAFRDCTFLKSVYFPASITSIGPYAFSGCNSIRDIYYEGSQSDWKKISIGENNNGLFSVLTTMHFNVKK